MTNITLCLLSDFLSVFPKKVYKSGSSHAFTVSRRRAHPRGRTRRFSRRPRRGALAGPRSGFSSSRTNLSPFTKDFRGGERLRVEGIFGGSASAELRLPV